MRLIDGDLLLEQMKRRKDYIGRPSDPVCLVEDAPAVDAEPVRHGRWIPIYELTREGILPDEPMGYMCDQCNAKRKKRLNYCSNCGAKNGTEADDGQE